MIDALFLTAEATQAPELTAIGDDGPIQIRVQPTRLPEQILEHARRAQEAVILADAALLGEYGKSTIDGLLHAASLKPLILVGDDRKDAAFELELLRSGVQDFLSYEELNGSQLELALRRAAARHEGRRGEDLLSRLLRAIGQALDFEQALQATLQLICERTGWLLGEAWLIAEDGERLLPGPLYNVQDIRALQSFVQARESHTFGRGDGLAGRVWANKGITWVPDVNLLTGDDYYRLPETRQLGLKATLAVPILADREDVLAVLLFYRGEAQPADVRLVTLISSAAEQLGLMLHHVQTEHALKARSRELSERVKELNLLYEIGKLMNRDESARKQALEAVVDRLPHAWERPEQICARIEIGDTDYQTENFRETAWYLQSPILEDDETVGHIEVNYLAEPREEDGQDPFLAEEQPLLDAVAAQLGMALERWHAERAVAESESRFRAIVDVAPVALCITRRSDGLILDANQMFADLVGMSRSELKGQVTPDFYADPDQRQTLMKELAEKGRVQEWELEVRRPDGSPAWILASVQPITIDDEPALLTVFLEITSRIEMEKELRQSEEGFRQIFRNSPLGMAVVGLDLRFRQANARLCEMLGYSAAELEQRTFADITHPEDVNSSMELASQLKSGEVSRHGMEKRYVRKDGDIIWIYLTVAIIRDDDGNPLYFLTMIEDIQERKEAEKQLERYRGELQRSNEELQQFAYVASHDLQEPLRMVTSYLQLIQRRYRDQLDEDADEFIDFAVDGANRMKTLINDLLAYSRVGTRGKEPQPTDAQAALHEALENLQMTVAESNAVVTYDELPIVEADDLQLVQLLQNLVGNAIKYRGEDPPQIHVGVERDEGQWLFSIADNGIGIDEQYADRIFAIFQRLHTRDQYGGTGIGLAICKKIVVRHGGRIWFESEPGQGTTFYFTLPIDDDATPSDRHARHSNEVDAVSGAPRAEGE